MNVSEKQQYVAMVLYNNPDGVSEQLAAMGLVEEGIFYDVPDLEAIIIRAAEMEAHDRGGNHNAYWEIVANAIDVEVNMDGSYAVEIMNHLHQKGNHALLMETSYDGDNGTMTNRGSSLIEFLLVTSLVLMILYLIRRL